MRREGQVWRRGQGSVRRWGRDVCEDRCNVGQEQEGALSSLHVMPSSLLHPPSALVPSLLHAVLPVCLGSGRHPACHTATDGPHVCHLAKAPLSLLISPLCMSYQQCCSIYHLQPCPPHTRMCRDEVSTRHATLQETVCVLETSVPSHFCPCHASLPPCHPHTYMCAEMRSAPFMPRCKRRRPVLCLKAGAGYWSCLV